MNQADIIISTLNLLPHPEGGYYSETYRSAQTVLNSDCEKRNVSTAIYFLLEAHDISKLHRIKSDELWFFHQGEALEIFIVNDGKAEIVKLGNSFKNGEVPQAMIPAGKWFGAKVSGGKGYALVSCTVAPGFDFADFEMADRNLMLAQYPQMEETIRLLT